MLSEKDMEEAIVRNPAKYIGEEGLQLIARQFSIGSYRFDLLFEDRHGGKLIVEIQRGILDRTHMFKILDYCDEFRERNPAEFVEPMIIANIIHPEHKRRLSHRGISFREIPQTEFAGGMLQKSDEDLVQPKFIPNDVKSKPGLEDFSKARGGTMQYWRINTDSEARKDFRTFDLWYKFGMVFAGDFEGKKGAHADIFYKLSPGDGVFMHHSRLGIVGYGVVKEKWNTNIYEGKDRLIYIRELYEYRIAVDWDMDCDCRSNPLAIKGRLPYMGTYSHVDTGKWDVDSVLQELKKRSSKSIKK